MIQKRIESELKKKGFIPIGSVTIKKDGDKKIFEELTGFFDEKKNLIIVKK
ncbi:MAG: hypothetical protein ACJA2S_004362 [Cyclobacteriaceae bacterium]|jgi:hypothetical protein